MTAPTFNRREQMTLDTLNVPVILNRLILNRLGEFSSLRFSQLKVMVKAAHPFAAYTLPSSSEVQWLNNEVEKVYCHILALHESKEITDAASGIMSYDELKSFIPYPPEQ